MQMSPSRNWGIATPTIPTILKIWSRTVPFLRAQTIPKRIPKTEDMTREVKVSSMVAGGGERGEGMGENGGKGLGDLSNM